MINGLLGWRAEPDMNLVAHPAIVGDSLKLLAWPYKNSYLVCLSNLPDGVSQLLVLVRKSKLVLHDLSNLSEPRLFNVALFIPDQGCRRHSGMNPLELTWPGLFLRRRFSKKKILDTFYRKELNIVKIANHPMMREVFKEKRQPFCGVSTHAKVDNPIMDFRVEIDLVALWLVGDRLPRTASAILCDFILRRAHMNDLIPSPLPLLLLNFAVHLWRLSVPRNKVGVKLEIGEALIL